MLLTKVLKKPQKGLWRTWRKAEERELEQELKQLDELKAANKHITETDDSELNDAQKQLKEFLLESQHEVSRRKEALKKHVENLEKIPKKQLIGSIVKLKLRGQSNMID